MSNVRHLNVYVAGYMAGSVLEECIGWRKAIRKHYEDWKGAGVPYPINFIDPFAGPEIESIDPEGLKSCIAPNAIFAGDMMSVKACDIVVANLDTFGQARPMIGTYFELGWCTAWQKDFILIVPKKDKELAENHPFLKQSAGVYTSVDGFLNDKILNYFYKRINGANY